MTEVTDSMKERIRKLLLKADNVGCTVAEAEAFNKKAHDLMARYNLDRATVIGKAETIIRTHKELQVLLRPWANSILHGICKLYYCKWFYTRGLGRGPDTITIVGEESNVAVCHAVSVMVLRAVQQEARSTRLGRSFMTGAGASIYSRCCQMATSIMIATDDVPKQLTAGQSTALVAYTGNEDQDNKAYIEDLIGGKLKTKKSTPRVKSSLGFVKGQAFGNTVNLKGNLLR